ncbi:hypothetical protein [Amycolatopsis kentuckyensis]|uniref:hypothetical protein n=1 Tax=Amycolatopsis kentuckyensis TaxID=218823 RepID=UPI000A3CC2D4|nr:hypothetical protein [Amycolatopsis kentuckyensis]
MKHTYFTGRGDDHDDVAYLLIANREFVGAVFDYSQAIAEAEEVSARNGWTIGIAKLPLIEMIQPESET